MKGAPLVIVKRPPMCPEAPRVWAVPASALRPGAPKPAAAAAPAILLLPLLLLLFLLLVKRKRRAAAAARKQKKRAMGGLQETEGIYTLSVGPLWLLLPVLLLLLLLLRDTSSSKTPARAFQISTKIFAFMSAAAVAAATKAAPAAAGGTTEGSSLREETVSFVFIYRV